MSKSKLKSEETCDNNLQEQVKQLTEIVANTTTQLAETLLVIDTLTQKLHELKSTDLRELTYRYGHFEYTAKQQLDNLTKTVSDVEYNTSWVNDRLEARVTDIEADLLAKSSQIELLTERACDRETDIQHLEDEIETIKSSLQEMHDRLYDVQNYKPISLKG